MQTKQTEQEYAEGDVGGVVGGEMELERSGGEGLSDLFTLPKSCQRDVISLRPTMKVISPIKGN